VKDVNAIHDLVWRVSSLLWVCIIVAIAVMVGSFYTGIEAMIRSWDTQEEYSYGYMIPFLTLFLIWQKKDQIERVSFSGSWVGLLLVVMGIVLLYLGTFSVIVTIIQYALLIVIIGTFLSLMGWQGLKLVLVPLCFLAFMVPIPYFIFANLSSELQLISSSIGVAVIRLFDISVYLEGNVIDLGSFKLQVVEACNGLRYLFPLVSLSFIAAYFFKGATWKKIILVLSSIPITIFMNSFRIGVIGVLVEYWGQSQAEGFLHDFEGWVIFMACMAILMLEMWALSKIGRDRIDSFQDAFVVDLPAHTPESASIRHRNIPTSFSVVIILLTISFAGIIALDTREENYPDRVTFDDFPTTIGEWKGKKDRLEQIYLDSLKLDDYIMADYVNSNNKTINFYSAYYQSQKTGESIHSPRACIPGGGWRIKDLSQKKLDGITVDGNALNINRLVIIKGDYKQVAYYWFQQRGRSMTNEYLVKWYLFSDALTLNRTDGALVRITTLVNPGEDVDLADKRIIDFIKASYPQLHDYIPD